MITVDDSYWLIEKLNQIEQIIKEIKIKMRLDITKEDILQTKILKPGPYVLEIKDVSEGASKTDGSNVTTIKFIVTDGSKLNDGSPATGVPVTLWISEKFKSEAAISLVNVLAGKEPANTEPVSVDLDNSIGKKVRAYIVNGQYNNKPTNVIEKFSLLNSK